MAAQVVVVGAGPTGLTMAAELARYGVPVRVIDRAAARSATSKALVLWSRTLELLDRAGCTESFVAAGHKVVAANIIAGGRPLGRVCFGGVDSPYPFALMLPQSETERLLELHLEGLGVVVERQVELTGLRDNGDGVVVALGHAGGRSELLDAGWVIGCDGAHSAVRHSLGLAFDGETLGSDWILADVQLAGNRVPTDEIATWWHEDGVIAVFPITATRFRVIADLGVSQGAEPVAPTLAVVQAILDRRGPQGLTASDPVWLSGFRINERKVADYRRGRVFLAGDAAHVHSPAGGQGMNTGMQDAINLAWKLALVWHGAASDALLDSYSAERGAVGEQVLRAAGRLTALATMRNRFGQRLRNLLGRFLLGLRPVRRALVAQITEVAVNYRHGGPGDGAGVSGPRRGDRIAPKAGQRPFGTGARPRFALLGVDSDALRRLAARFPDLVDPAPMPPPDAAGVWLVRPDGYAACRARAGDLTGITDYLDRVAGLGGVR
ncbi:hypothetical protein GCM10011529_24530 [Polymorphobacter glacialis]|uniref:FAD-binding domain-containing protein n=1 Tax=Sandarakinorhabdus glacialis TaxID=1614636 RepID=A0A917EBG1_9SPHN|nr:FAD-dependent monooxygenase [Polymorphobacter glacialis]GGE17148.1 hypothetical protein GCM10011529_24530 [Polymorphobacter glacialis]